MWKDSHHNLQPQPISITAVSLHQTVPDVTYGPNSFIYNIILWGGADWRWSDMRNIWQAGKTGPSTEL
ncbi:MAG: hypothetical protein WDM78_05070 [Puia sp.]